MRKLIFLYSLLVVAGASSLYRGFLEPSDNDLRVARYINYLVPLYDIIPFVDQPRVRGGLGNIRGSVPAPSPTARRRGPVGSTGTGVSLYYSIHFIQVLVPVFVRYVYGGSCGEERECASTLSYCSVEGSCRVYWYWWLIVAICILLLISGDHSRLLKCSFFLSQKILILFYFSICCSVV